VFVRVISGSALHKNCLFPQMWVKESRTGSEAQRSDRVHLENTQLSSTSHPSLWRSMRPGRSAALRSRFYMFLISIGALCLMSNVEVPSRR